MLNSKNQSTHPTIKSNNKKERLHVSEAILILNSKFSILN